MNIAIFSDSPEKLPLNFQRFGKNSKHTLNLYTVKKLRQIIKENRIPDLIYIDIESVNKVDSLLSYLSKQKAVFWGIIDFNQRIKDVAKLFFNGCVDYINRDVADSLNISRRIKLVDKYLMKFGTGLSEEKNARLEKPKKIGWQSIHEGNEYPFYIMFIELDNRSRLEKTWGKHNLEKAISTFKVYVERMVTEYDGRVWIWSGFSGIILFPFSEGTNPVLCGFKMMIYKYIFDVEESLFPNFVSFRIAIHLGRIRYVTKSKGNVISDSINFVVHLGKRYALPGNLYISEYGLKNCRNELKEYFYEEKQFEDHLIYRMRRPIMLRSG